MPKSNRVPSPSPPASDSPRRGGWWIVLGASAVVSLAVYWFTRPDDDPPAPPPPPAPQTVSFAVTPLSESPFLNTRPDAKYVGSAACRACHEGRHASFRSTGMGRSMADVDLAREPPDASFDHPLSKRRYQVVRKDGRMWHRELLLHSGAEEILLAEYPLRYVVGSGRHSLTYVAEADGFLVESPVTWYRSKNAWAMSPGYDHPHQDGFGRAVGEGCLNCHAGHASAVGESLHKMQIAEAAIGCERCHGPGSLHVAKHGGKGPPADARRETDFTIVNPARLSRDLAEAVCQQCHLRPSAVVLGRGRSFADFRPGLPLQDVRQDYLLDAPDAKMTVVGHVEQMRLSRCYTASGTLSCVTCHSPHGEPKPEAKVAHYKRACATCHQPAACKVAPDERARRSPGNDCVRCHMPTSPTEIPHLAFTHHRIGVHGKDPPPARPAAPPALRPLHDLSRFGEVDRTRSLGLGYLEAANRAKDDAARDQYQRRALALMTEAREAGLCDPALDANLARLRSELGLDRVGALAEGALARPGLVAQDRCTALFLLAEDLKARGRPADAIPHLRRLTQLRRHSHDWLLLADCEQAAGNDAAVEEALLAAVRINPRLPRIHQHLADRYQGRGDAAKAEWHRKRAVP